MEIRANCTFEAVGALQKTTQYVGERHDGAVEVWKIRAGVKTKLQLRLDLWNHSPTGFEWGYGGSGPAQLALALLADALRNDDFAIELHQSYKWEVVANWEQGGWITTTDAISTWAYRHDQEREDAVYGAESKGQPDSAAGGGE